MTTVNRLRPRRSCLAVPGSNPRFLEKAQGLPADQVFLDLEDACAPLAKPEARHTIVKEAYRILPNPELYANAGDIVEGARSLVEELYYHQIEADAAGGPGPLDPVNASLYFTDDIVGWLRSGNVQAHSLFGAQDFDGSVQQSVLPLLLRDARRAGLRVCFVRVQRRPRGTAPPAFRYCGPARASSRIAASPGNSCAATSP